MSTTVTNDLKNKDDAKNWVNFFIGQAEQVAKIVITKNGAAYKGEVTLNDPPAAP